MKAAVEHIGAAREAAHGAAEAATRVTEASRDLATQSAALRESTEALIRKIDGVDFPTRLDKLDATVSSINLGLQNVQSRLEGTEHRLSDEIKASRETLAEWIESLAVEQAAATRRVQLNGLLLMVVAVLVVILLVLQFVPT